MEFHAEILNPLNHQVLESFSDNIEATELFPEVFERCRVDGKPNLNKFIVDLCCSVISKTHAGHFTFSMEQALANSHTACFSEHMYCATNVLYGEDSCLLSCSLTPNNYERDRIEGKSPVQFHAKCDPFGLQSMSFGAVPLKIYSDVDVEWKQP